MKRILLTLLVMCFFNGLYAATTPTVTPTTIGALTPTPTPIVLMVLKSCDLDKSRRGVVIPKIPDPISAYILLAKYVYDYSDQNLMTCVTMEIQLMDYTKVNTQGKITALKNILSANHFDIIQDITYTTMSAVKQ